MKWCLELLLPLITLGVSLRFDPALQTFPYVNALTFG